MEDGELSANDRAFITVAKEVICLRNDIEAMESLVTIRIEDYTRSRLKDFSKDRVHSPEFHGISQAIKILADPQAGKQDVARARMRLTKLEKLAQAYMEGRDIIQAKLMDDGNG